WILGWFMCKAVSYLQGVSVSASVNTLVAISLERFLAICYPMKGQITTRVARNVIVLIWTFSLLISLPWAVHFSLTPLTPDLPDIELCVEMWPHPSSELLYFILANLVLCYLFPLCLITACYVGIWVKVWRRHIPGETNGNARVSSVIQRSKLKVVKMMLIVVIIFVMSWLPLYIIFTRIKIGGDIEPNSLEENILVVIAPIAQWLGSSNSCINPVLYAFLNKKFRKGFKAIIKSKKCCGTLRYETPSSMVLTTRAVTLRSTQRFNGTHSTTAV
ncbi:neuropeptide SIFamide receptor-like, partial [Limulus polyphemus]|uniref:Neuropeptide SIFamide receptor-like n=1 Tax=Limulus polyphemus TaxID=6850 RepID=A0ABM1BVS9_LIMPO